MRDWFAANTAWVAPLIAVILAAIGWRIQFYLKKRGGGSQIRQRQRGGDRSTNIQVAGDFTQGPTSNDGP